VNWTPQILLILVVWGAIIVWTLWLFSRLPEAERTVQVYFDAKFWGTFVAAGASLGHAARIVFPRCWLSTSDCILGNFVLAGHRLV
jgi:hypothetical protein